MAGVKIEEKLDKILVFVESVRDAKTKLKRENAELKKKVEQFKEIERAWKQQEEIRKEEKKKLEEKLGRFRTYLSDFGITITNEGNLKGGGNPEKLREMGAIINERNQTIQALREEIEQLTTKENKDQNDNIPCGDPDCVACSDL